MKCSSTGGSQPPIPPANTPEATRFKNIEGKVAFFFFRNNPWKLSEPKTLDKHFRYCVVCGDPRISREEWAKAAKFNPMFGFPTICDKSYCFFKKFELPSFVPRKHFVVETESDKKRVARSEKEEFYEEVENFTDMYKGDKVFGNESDIPQDYVELFKKLESTPLRQRILIIEKIYFEHMKNNNIVVGEYMNHTRDLFLRALAYYHQQCYDLLKRKLQRAKL